MIGPWEIFMILLIALLVFGAGRLPTIMGDLAKGVKSFKEGLKDEDVAQKQAEDPKRLTHDATDAQSGTTTNKDHAA